MTGPQRYDFEGERLSISEINAKVPRLSRSAVAKGIRAGRNTVQALLCFDPNAAAKAGASKGAKTSPFSFGRRKV